MDLFSSHIDDEANIELTPLIDVIFMLLIFFIMTTTFSKPVLEVVLPESEQAEVGDSKNKEVLISISKEGAIFYKDKEIQKEELVSILNQSEDLLNIYVDKEAPFQSFVDVVDIAKKEREGRFVISTEPKKS